MRNATLLLVLALSTAHAADAWKTYTHESPAFSIDHPATWDVTVAERFADASIGGHTLEGEADVTFEVKLRDEPLRIMVFAYAIPPDCDTAELLDALREDAGERGRLTRYEGVGGHDTLPSVRHETKDVGRAEILTYLFDLERLFLVHMNVPDTWLEACREGYDHAVRSLETDLLARRPRLELPSAEAFATDLVKVIEATETLRNAEMIRLFDEGTDLLRKGLAQGRRIFFKLAQHKFRAMLDIDRNVALGQFALGLAHFYAWEMGAAQEQFREAVRLDKDLEPLVPLLWWEDFHELPADRISKSSEEVRFRWHLTADGVLSYRGKQQHGARVQLHDPQAAWMERDVSVMVRFRFVSGEPILQLYSRREFWPNYRRHGLSGSLSLGSCYVSWTDMEGVYRFNRTEGFYISPGWHTGRFVACGNALKLYVDGVLVASGRCSDDLLLPGTAALGLGGSGEQMVDWVLVTRYSE